MMELEFATREDIELELRRRDEQRLRYAAMQMNISGNTGMLLVAMHDSNLVGTASLEGYDGTEGVFLHTLFVSESWRRKGIASEFIRVAKEIVIEKGLGFLSLDTKEEDLHEMFRKLGFTKCLVSDDRVYFTWRPEPKGEK